MVSGVPILKHFTVMWEECKIASHLTTHPIIDIKKNHIKFVLFFFFLIVIDLSDIFHTSKLHVYEFYVKKKKVDSLLARHCRFRILH